MLVLGSFLNVLDLTNMPIGHKQSLTDALHMKRSSWEKVYVTKLCLCQQEEKHHIKPFKIKFSSKAPSPPQKKINK